MAEPVETPPAPDKYSAETGLLDLFVLLARHKGKVIALPLALAIAGILWSFIVTPLYTGITKIMPPQQNQQSVAVTAALAQLGALGSFAGGALGQNPNDVYVAMLKSETVLDRIIRRFDLMKVYGTKFMFDTRRALEGSLRIFATKDGIITVEYTDEDPARSAVIANAFVEELEAVTFKLAVSEASRRRAYYENHLKKAKVDYDAAALDFNRFKEQHGLVQMEGQAGLALSAASTLRAQVTAKELQLGSMATFATNSNPEYARARQELADLRTQLGRMERQASTGKGDVLLSLSSVREVGLQYFEKFRDVKFHEAMFEVLTRSYETARLDESKNATLIQVLDPALTPERRSWPRRRVMALVWGFVGLVIGVVWLGFEEWVRRVQQDPERSRKFQQLRDLVPARLRTWRRNS